ncbi:CRISPR-associated endoribonuclease Cas6 [Tindallia californiensis]|uniref:CRISPR-associated endoribonuclease n=1 Tax=Tindallia californiensis TaxID=159292 RepID=A0A1H3PQD6_9FIRM|nr:CRISPR-associated endoribonuclease Cas6 [Tindallia californiensis]SDZ03266.1 CRISPR-associated protein, Cas6 family [Tindallia californiensis]
MRLEITFKAEKRVSLPIHYNYYLQGMIYRHISKELATFLHDNGFPYENRKFRLFCFSQLEGDSVYVKKNKRIEFDGLIKLNITSPIPEFCQELGNSLLFAETVELANQTLKVQEVAARSNRVIDSKGTFKLISPATVYSTLQRPDGGKYTVYHSPEEKEFEQQVDKNLRKKYMSLYGQEPPKGLVKTQPLNPSRQSVIYYKTSFIKGYSCQMQMEGPIQLLQMAMDTGIGSKNSQGFGCLKEIERR